MNSKEIHCFPQVSCEGFELRLRHDSLEQMGTVFVQARARLQEKHEKVSHQLFIFKGCMQNQPGTTAFRGLKQEHCRFRATLVYLWTTEFIFLNVCLYKDKQDIYLFKKINPLFHFITSIYIQCLLKPVVLMSLLPLFLHFQCKA